MIDIKCLKVGKVYRGQDFWKHYCRHCDEQDQVRFENDEMTCPNLRYYQSFVPKQEKRHWGGRKVGDQASIPRGDE